MQKSILKTSPQSGVRRPFGINTRYARRRPEPERTPAPGPPALSATPPPAKGKGKGKVSPKGYSKGKGKGKYRAPASSSSQWKETPAEARQEEAEGKEYEGVVEYYNFRGGWGKIKPAYFQDLPANVQAKLEEAREKAQAEGKEGDHSCLWFKKSDILGDSKVGKQSLVAFRVYVDARGAGAYDITSLEQGDPEEFAES